MECLACIRVPNMQECLACMECLAGIGVSSMHRVSSMHGVSSMPGARGSYPPLPTTVDVVAGVSTS